MAKAETDFEVSLPTVLGNWAMYEACKDELKEIIFEGKKERTATIAVVFEDGVEQVIGLGRFLVGAIIMRPLVKFGAGRHVGKDYFAFEVNADGISRKVDWVITRLFGEADPQEINLCVADVLRELSDLAVAANDSVGNTVSIRSLLMAANRNPELMGLLNLSIPDGLQFHEIEEFVDLKLRRLVKILSEEDTCLRDMVLCGSAVNTKQLGQALMNVSLKPDLFGRVIPSPIDTSFLRGLRGVEDYFINSIGARKALITNYKQVKVSGYLARKLALLTVDTHLDASLIDCETHGTVPIHIKDHRTFERIVGRTAVGPDGIGIVEESDFEHLRGKDLEIRSPITCAGPNGVCRACYGSLAELNKDLHAGLLGILILSSQLTQLLN